MDGNIKVNPDYRPVTDTSKPFEVERCYECDEEIYPEQAFTYVELFDTPWDDKGHEEVLHLDSVLVDVYKRSCLELLQEEEWADFRYFICEHCRRMVCRQNPANGFHSQVRVINECEDICLRCYQEYILENGVDPEALEAGRLPGMFFKGGNPELLEAGYTCIEEGMFIGASSAAHFLCGKALDLIAQGYKVVIAYETMGIGGGEGYVSLYAKRVEHGLQV